MKIPLHIQRDLLVRASKLDKRALRPEALDFIPATEHHTGRKALAKRAGFIGTDGASSTRLEFERLMGTNDLVDEFYLQRALLSAMPVCRIVLRTPAGHERGWGTGVMVSPRLLLTNQHVLTSPEDAEHTEAEFNYTLDIAARPVTSYRFRLRPELYFHNNAGTDMALVAVEPTDVEGNTPLQRFGYHRLIRESGKAWLKEWMTIVQHPQGGRRQFAIRENQCINDADDLVLWYKSDTAKGSSGAPVFNDSFQLVALHHAGVARKNANDTRYILLDGTQVKSIDDVEEGRVDWIANAGIRVSRICKEIERAPEKSGYIAELREAMQGGDILTNAFSSTTTPPPVEIMEQDNKRGGNRIVIGTLVLELGNGSALPGLLDKFAGAATLTTAISAAGNDAVEALKRPYVEDNTYAQRKGFDTKFLGTSTPVPTITERSLIAPMLAGGTRIPYEHFSVVMHKERRLAMFTASNVDHGNAAKRPEAGKVYTRAALTGLTGKYEMEEWVLDPRLDAKCQIPDAFYTKDNGAFDKGHICRRDDVCFGTNYQQIRRACGDSYHVTNCSPQRKGFNQSQHDGIWGELENYIGLQGKTEQYCVFAGPVLAADDPVFVGTERVQLPIRFWKVVCAVLDGHLQVFAFVLEQDVHDLPLEFQVEATWKRKQVKLKDLERIIGLVKFQKKYHDADQA